MCTRRLFWQGLFGVSCGLLLLFAHFTAVVGQSVAGNPAQPPDNASDLLFSSMLGDGLPADAGEQRWQSAWDAAGFLYVAGLTADPNFAVTPGLGGPMHGITDIFVTKWSSDGATLIYATLLGGDNDWYRESVAELVVDATGAVYLVGEPGSPTFPTTPGAFDTECNPAPWSPAGCLDAFVAKLDPDGRLIYSTFLGGAVDLYGVAATTIGRAIAVDQAGAVYVAGHTDAVDFPTTPGAFQRTSLGVPREAIPGTRTCSWPNCSQLAMGRQTCCTARTSAAPGLRGRKTLPWIKKGRSMRSAIMNILAASSTFLPHPAHWILVHLPRSLTPMPFSYASLRVWQWRGRPAVRQPAWGRHDRIPQLERKPWQRLCLRRCLRWRP